MALYEGMVVRVQEIKVLVEDERVPEFYEMFGRWLAGTAADEATSASTQVEWGKTEDDLALAKVVWGKLSDRAQSMFTVLIDAPDVKVSGEKLAADLNIPNGKYGVAGVLAWPGRHCAAVGRTLPVRYEDGAKGESANYWMEPEVAATFAKARDSK